MGSVIMRYFNHRRLFLWIVGLAAVAAGPRLPSAFGQADSLADWATKEKDGKFAEPLKIERVQFPGIGAALRTGNWNDPVADPPLFDDYYQKQVFPWITHADKRGQREDVIAKLRSDFKQLSRNPNALNGPVLPALVAVTLGYMPKIATDPKWSPSVRIDAILAIGEVKSPGAVPVLLDLIRNTQINRAFRAAAMAAMAQLDDQNILANLPSTNPQVAATLVSTMASAAKSPTKPQPDALRWMRGQAADILGAIGVTGATGEVPTALLVMLADPDLPLTQRGKAARALGRLKYTNGPPDTSAYVKALAEFGSDALSADLPADASRIRTVARDFLAGIAPLLTQPSVPKVVGDMKTAMSTLQRDASRDPPRGLSEKDLKEAIAKTKPVFDAAAGRK